MATERQELEKEIGRSLATELLAQRDTFQAQYEGLREAVEGEIRELQAAEKAAIDLKDKARADGDSVSALIHDEWRQCSVATAQRLQAVLTSLQLEGLHPESCENCGGTGHAKSVWEDGQWTTHCVVCRPLDQIGGSD